MPARIAAAALSVSQAAAADKQRVADLPRAVPMQNQTTANMLFVVASSYRFLCGAKIILLLICLAYMCQLYGPRRMPGS